MPLKTVKHIFYHLLVWAVVLIFPLFLMSRGDDFPSRIYQGYMARTALFAAIFYFNYLWLIDKYLFSKRWGLFVGINVALFVILGYIQFRYIDVMFAPPGRGGRRGGPSYIHGGTMLRMISNYLVYFFAAGVAVTLKTTRRWYRDSISFEQAKSNQLEADLRTLRNQLNPHFLFNTLNNIYSLIPVDPAKAQDSVHRLSGLLRYVLYSDDHNFVPLDKELEFTRNYIDLMKLRVNPDMKLSVKIDNRSGGTPIAPLMFMTFIENAFKHGVGGDGESSIDIRIEAKDNGVECVVENSLNRQPHDLESKNKGIGLANLSKRLELLYPGRYECRTEIRGDRFFAFLRIDSTEKA